MKARWYSLIWWVCCVCCRMCCKASAYQHDIPVLLDLVLFVCNGVLADFWVKQYLGNCKKCYVYFATVEPITHTHTHLTTLFPGLPGWAGTRKVKPIWILLKRETVSGSDISWAVCKFAPSSRQRNTPAPHHSSFFTGRMPFLPPNEQRQSTEGKLNRSSCVITVLIVFMLCSSIPWSKTVLSHFCCSCFYGLYEMH